MRFNIWVHVTWVPSWNKTGGSVVARYSAGLSIGGDGGSIPPTAISKLRQLRSPHICLSFGRDTKSRWSLLSGVYARGSKRSHTRGKCVTCSGLTNFRWTLKGIWEKKKLSTTFTNDTHSQFIQDLPNLFITSDLPIVVHTLRSQHPCSRRQICHRRGELKSGGVMGRHPYLERASPAVDHLIYFHLEVFTMFQYPTGQHDTVSVVILGSANISTNVQVCINRKAQFC